MIDARPVTVGPLLADAGAALRAAGSPTPRLDAEVLLAHVVGRDRAWVVAHPEAAMGLADAVAFRQALDRRTKGEPVAYIRGYKEWLSLRIITDARALVPRPETEVLAEAAMDEVGRRLSGAGPAEPIVAWDVGTGTGAVAVAVALRFRDALADGALRLVASDVSGDALDLAADNLRAHRLDALVTLLEADLLTPAQGAVASPHVVVANLPYLPTPEVDSAVGSLPHEPRVALDGGPDGLVLLRRLFDELSRRTAPGATVLLEVALGQADAVAGLAPDGAVTEALPDLGGVPRVIVVRLPS